MSWTEKRVAGALYRAVRDELDGADPATTSGVARSEQMSRYAVHRAIAALTAAGWVDRRQTVFYLVARPGPAPVRAPYHDCPQCDGTGWREIPQPPGALSDVPEQPWVVKCERCGGSGTLPGPEAAPDA